MGQVVAMFSDDGQTTLEQLAAEREQYADRARRTGEQRAEHAEDPTWLAAAFNWIAELPSGTIFSGDDLRAARGTSNASGPVFKRAAVAGLIVKHDVVTSTAPSRHGALTQRWVRVDDGGLSTSVDNPSNPGEGVP